MLYEDVKDISRLIVEAYYWRKGVRIKRIRKAQMIEENVFYFHITGRTVKIFEIIVL